MLVGYLAWFTWASYQAEAKIDDEVPELVDQRGRVDVEVELAFTPERFHILVIQDHGRIRRTIGDTVHVRAEIPDLRRLARRHWIVGIRPAEDPLGLSGLAPHRGAHLAEGPTGGSRAGSESLSVVDDHAFHPGVEPQALGAVLLERRT